MNKVTESAHKIDDATLSDTARRKVLLAATGAMGAAGLVAVAYPFVASMEPSELARAMGGPVLADISTLGVGELRTVAWRGKPVWLMRRSKEMIDALQQPDSVLADPLSKRSEQPASCANPTRSKRPDIFVAVGVCTHLGCTPILAMDNGALNAELHAPGGFLCPCHGSRFDLAGRVVKNVPAPINLEIPDYAFIGASSVQIG